MSVRSRPLRIAVAQINTIVGDIGGNAAKLRGLTERARAEGADLVIFPELALSGYPPEDLLLKRHFLDAAAAALDELASAAAGIVALVGFPERSDDVHNAAAVLADGRVAGIYRKMLLPNYGVFDEQRYFQAGTEPVMIEVGGTRIGITICEDIWEPGPPASAEALAGAEVIVNLSASPYHLAKGAERERMLTRRARDHLASVVFCNMVGAQDELVFDGHSVVVDASGELVARLPQFEEAFEICAIDPGTAASQRLLHARRPTTRQCVQEEQAQVALLGRFALNPSEPTSVEVGGRRCELMEPEQEVYTALRTGLRDYVDKNGFERVVLGLSGGIDSALSTLIAVDALGPERVACVAMPSRYSSVQSQADARKIASNVDAELIELPIDTMMSAFETALAEQFDGAEPDVTEENLQARIRGSLLMALSNKFGFLVLTTGNKSELSVGYATLYGDMAGGFAVLKDVFKDWVYRLVRWRNGRDRSELVPASVLERAPSAELRYEQRDDDSLPPYELLDRILAGYIEDDLDAAQLVGRGLPWGEVERVIRMVDAAEYKRRQAPPGIRISTKAFGRDRRLPITNRFPG